MTSSSAAQAQTEWTSLLFKQRERAACSQLRLSHRIYETMALGMHPATPNPRRNRFAPTGGSVRGEVADTAGHRDHPDSTANEASCQVVRKTGVIPNAQLDLPGAGSHNAAARPGLLPSFAESRDEERVLSPDSPTRPRPEKPLSRRSGLRGGRGGPVRRHPPSRHPVLRSPTGEPERLS
jgi:hypothetical protein